MTHRGVPQPPYTGRTLPPTEHWMPTGGGRTGLAILALLLFASGAAALIYQILWIKQLSLVVGVDVHAVTTGVSAFFAGLALGRVLFGRWADRLSRTFLLYAFLELGVAVLGVTATLALARAAQPFAALEEVAGPLAWVLLSALVAGPAALMGGTLPVLIRSRAPQAGQVGAAGGRLYAANTAGAIAGALLTSFVLIPLVGVRGTEFAAAAINLAAAAGALGLDRATSPLALKARCPNSPGLRAKRVSQSRCMRWQAASHWATKWSGPKRWSRS